MNDRTSCSGIRTRFPDLLYGEASPEARRSLAHHLETCLSCREELALLRSTLHTLDLWELEPFAGDPHAIAAAARASDWERPRTARKWVRLSWIAAAAVLVFLCVLESEVRVDGAEMVVRLGLPGRSVPRSEGASAVPATVLDESRIQAIAREEVLRHSSQEAELWVDFAAAQDRERARLIRALDLARAEDRRRFLELVDSLASHSVQENERTRDALIELASLVTTPQKAPTAR